MSNGQLQELIQADLDGELSGAGRAELARLLLQDPDARRLHGELRLTDQLLRDIPSVEPPPGLRAAILGPPAVSARPSVPAGREYGPARYRMAATILGGLLIVGISYLLIDGNSPRTNLQGSLGAASGPKAVVRTAPKDQLSLRAEGVEVSASLRRDSQWLRLELNSTTTIPCEVIARFDPATTTLVGSHDGALLNAASGQVTVQLATGKQDFVLDFAGVAPVKLELRSAGRLLGEGKLSVSEP